MAGHTAHLFPEGGVLQQLWVQTDAQSPQPAAPLRSGSQLRYVPFAHFILDHHLVILLTLGQKGQLHFLFFRKIVFKSNNFLMVLFTFFNFYYKICQCQRIYMCVCLYNTCSLKISNKTNGHVPTTLLKQ